MAPRSSPENVRVTASPEGRGERAATPRVRAIRKLPVGALPQRTETAPNEITPIEDPARRRVTEGAADEQQQAR
jgi:hypothetical protein